MMDSTRVSPYDWYQSELAMLRRIASAYDFTPMGDAAYQRQYRRAKAAYRQAARMETTA